MTGKQPDIPPVEKQPRRRTRPYDAPRENFDVVAQTVAELLVPPGTYVPCASDTEYDGWKLCNGQALSAADYPRLFEIFGTQFGGGGGSFNLPDWTGRMPIGAGGAAGVSNLATGGAAQINLTVDQLPEHGHNLTDTVHSHTFTPTPHAHTGGSETSTVGAAAGSDVTAAAPGTNSDESAGGTVESAETGASIEKTGNGDPVDILPPVFGVYWLVRA